MSAYDLVKAGGVRNFSLDEWSEPKILKLVSPRLLNHIDTLRELYGQRIHPSQLSAGWARLDGRSTSRHYAKGRLSDAGDIFPEGDVLRCWLTALTMGVFGGIGLYLDTNKSRLQPGAMMHVDCRSAVFPVLWVRNETGDYVYENAEPDKFWSAIKRVRLK